MSKIAWQLMFYFLVIYLKSSVGELGQLINLYFEIDFQTLDNLVRVNYDGQ